MGILNSHQLLAGARRFNLNEPYIIGGFVGAPTIAVDGTTATKLNITNGQLEFDGFAVNGSASLDFASLPILKPSTKYIVAVTAAYTEPVDKTAATSAGVNYFVYGNSLGESILEPFVDVALETAVSAAGGYTTLERRVYNGSATVAEQNTLALYDDAIQRLSDPRYVGHQLPIRTDAFEIIVAEVVDQNNFSSNDRTSTMTADDFAALKSRTNLYRQKKQLARAAAITAYETPGKIFKIYRAYGYTSSSNMLNQVNATLVDLTAATPFTSSASGLTHFEVIEYYYPSYMPLGLQGNRPALVELFSKKELSSLGRIDPIYFGGNYDSSRLVRYQRARLTKQANPVVACAVTTDSTAASISLVSGVSYEGLVANSSANPVFPY